MARRLINDKIKKKYWIIGGIGIFFLYILAAPRPIPEETILIRRWVTSLESDYPMVVTGPGRESPGPEGYLPFTLGNHYGYIGGDGKFLINGMKRGAVSVSDNYWAAYGPRPDRIEVFTPYNESVMTIEHPGGYPFFLDNRVFLLGSEQNSVTLLDQEGKEEWTYAFSGILTSIDAAAGFVLTGSLDGVVELIDSNGKQAILPIDPGGSRLSIILGCALSRDASRIAIISGIDDQRFLLYERSGDTFKPIYHEFLTDGFRKPVAVTFIDNDSGVAYEREGGLGLYDIHRRVSLFIPLEGEIIALDGTGTEKLIFLLTAQEGNRKSFAAVRLPGSLIIQAPFRSRWAFLGRRGSRIYVGGDSKLASFGLGKN